MKLHLLKGRQGGGYATFGTCWNKGEVQGAQFCLTDAAGQEIPMQTEIAARWPDGSVKWGRHTADSGRMGDTVEVTPGAAAALDKRINVTACEDGWQVDAGRVTLKIPRAGSSVLIRDVRLDGQMRITAMEPVFQLERRRETAAGEDITIRATQVNVEHVLSLIHI